MKKRSWILVILAILVIVIIVMNWKKWFGKGGGKGTHGTSGGLTSIGTDAQATADRLYDLMKGFTYTYSSKTEVDETLQKVIDANNLDFIAVWNAFGKRDGDNLADWAQGEWYLSSKISDGLRNRAQSLGLN